MQIHEQTCPLCGNSAQFQFLDFNNRKHFRCSICSEYIVSVRAEKRLLESISQWRESYSALAMKSVDGKILVITVPSIHKAQGTGNEALQGEFLPRSEVVR